MSDPTVHPSENDPPAQPDLPEWLDEPAAMLLALRAALAWEQHNGADFAERSASSVAAAEVANFFVRAGAETGPHAPTSPGGAGVPSPASPPRPRPAAPAAPIAVAPAQVARPREAQTASEGLRLDTRPRLIPVPSASAAPTAPAAQRPAARTPPSAATPPADPAAAIAALHQQIGDCTRCGLCEGRSAIVHGRGDPRARLLIVTGGVGGPEDAAGHPLVGDEAMLLSRMLGAIGVSPEQVWLAPLVRCRLPGEGADRRSPSQAELRACAPILARELDIVRPAVVIAAGEVAARFLLRAPGRPLVELRERWHEARGTPTLATWAPADLIRDPGRKREAWADLQEVARRLADRPDRGH